MHEYLLGGWGMPIGTSRLSQVPVPAAQDSPGDR
jgi:hypothetical protein